MMARIVAVAVAFLCLGALVVESRPRPRDNSPSKLEKTCPFEGAWAPCFIVDEALQQQWDI